MTSLANAAPLRAFGYGAGLAGLNPKNLLFNIVAGTAIAGSGASATGELVAWILYILLASLAVLTPVAWFLVAPAAAAARLESPRPWLIRNSPVMVAMIVLAIGVSQIGEGISGLG
jgi:threonine/homoserine/homoserine lactone efflux protein